MRWRNTDTAFGLPSKLLHWALAVLIIGLIGFGMYIEDLKVSLDNLHLFNWHKALGILAFSLILLRLLWRFLSPPPPVLGPSGWQATAAHWVHRLFYILMVAMPLCGWIASSATGFEISFFGLFPIPLITPENEPVEMVFFAQHGIIGKLLIFLILLHVAGAMQRQFVKRDGTLRRMWF